MIRARVSHCRSVDGSKTAHRDRSMFYDYRSSLMEAPTIHPERRGNRDAPECPAVLAETSGNKNSFYQQGTTIGSLLSTKTTSFHYAYRGSVSFIPRRRQHSRRLTLKILSRIGGEASGSFFNESKIIFKAKPARWPNRRSEGSTYL